MTVRTLDADALREWPLPALAKDADKEVRGRILVVAGSREIAGAAVLAATAALRMGAGKLLIATAASAATQMMFAMPEARVIALPETKGGGFAIQGVDLIEPYLRDAHAAVIGPGMMDTDATVEFTRALMPQFAHTPVLLDAAAMDVLLACKRFDSPVLLTPHAGEMAHLTGDSKEAVSDDQERVALDAAKKWNAFVALKGATTLVATPEGQLWRHVGGSAGLATSGSGDTLAGAIAGLCARGATLEQACAWGVVLHARAGEQLSKRISQIGYLAREIPDEMLAVLNDLSPATPG